MNLKDIMLSEISQTQKESIVYFQLYEFLRIAKLIEKADYKFPGAEGSMNGENLMSTQFMFGTMKKFWKWIMLIIIQL